MGIDNYNYDGAYENTDSTPPSISPWSRPEQLTTEDVRRTNTVGSGDVPGLFPLPAVDINGEVEAQRQGDRTQQWPDKGKFDTDEQQRAIKTVSEDGTKTREFTYGNAQNPDEITRVKIDGSREYMKAQEGVWDYYVDGQYVGKWNGSVSMSKDGVYRVNGANEGTMIYGSGRDQIQEPPPKPPQPVQPIEPPPPVVTPADQNPSGVIPADFRPQPAEQRPEQSVIPAGYAPLGPIPEGDPPLIPPQPVPELQPPQPEIQPPQPRPEQTEQPEQPKPPERVELKEHYEAADVEQGFRDAIKNGVPVVVRVGSTTCGPCRIMEANVWPSLQNELKGQAAFMHLDADEVLEQHKGGELAESIVKPVEGYPTYMILRPYLDDQGQVKFEQLKSGSGGIDIDATRAFLRGQ